MNLTPEQLAELKTLAESATPAPWKSYADDNHILGPKFELVCQARSGGVVSISVEQRDRNSAFIAAAREAIPALIADLEESNARIADLENGHTNVDAEYARQFDTNAAVESSKAERELSATRKQLEEAQAENAEMRQDLKRIGQALDPLKSAECQGHYSTMINHLESKLAAAEKDAARWKELTKAEGNFAIAVWSFNGEWRITSNTTGVELIDAAIAAQEGK